MGLDTITHCPGTLAEGHTTYSRSCLTRLFNGRTVSHVLPYFSPTRDSETYAMFNHNVNQMSISGVQEKYSVLLDKNKLRLINEGEQGEYILKPIPSAGKKPIFMPAIEHLSMQIAQQAFDIDVAHNALIFFKDGSPAYLTKRFDIASDGSKLAQEDFASLMRRTPQTHGEHYKYAGNYLELFELMKKIVPAYAVEAPKLLKRLIFNYLISNGDAHVKNFSLIETSMGDFKLSPAYDLLNSRIHIQDQDFALEDGLLPKNLAHGKILTQFKVVSEKAGIPHSVWKELITTMTKQSHLIETLVYSSFLDKKTQRNYLQTYQARLRRLLKE